MVSSAPPRARLSHEEPEAGNLHIRVCVSTTPSSSARRLSVLALHVGPARFFSLGIAWETRPRPHRWCRTSRLDLGVLWPSRLVAAAAEDRLNIA